MDRLRPLGGRTRLHPGTAGSEDQRAKKTDQSSSRPAPGMNVQPHKKIARFSRASPPAQTARGNVAAPPLPVNRPATIGFLVSALAPPHTTSRILLPPLRSASDRPISRHSAAPAPIV